MAEPEEIVIEPTRKFQGKFSSSLAARAELFYALRKMSDEDYHAGRRVTVNCLYREGYELVYKTASYRIGGKPRPERSWEVMSTEFAEAIKREFRSHLNVVTTFLKTSVLLNDVEEINVVQLGGCVHKKSLSAIGVYAEAALSDFSCSKLFFGVDGIDLEHGITTSTIEEAKLTQVMMRSASKIIILADSSKFGQRGFGRICALEDIDVIVTDERIPEQMVSIIEEAGVDLIIAK